MNHPGSAAPVFYVQEEEAAVHDAGTMLGFWIYLMSDALLFASIFATFGVLSSSFAGGPTPHELFDLGLVAVNTAILLVSALTCGLAMISMHAGKVGATRAWLAVTGLLGAAFVAIELHEFMAMAAEGATPQRSAYLSAFFTLVGTHGLHVTFGVIWVAVMLVQLGQRGLHHENHRRLMCLSMFWHFLDVIWIGVFSFVYLMGVL
ncbi:MAG: cytochrome o ubiquinol oxidase subunit III [Pseudomonadota bacterium]|jgi:cytochrome o ubiquinol oxidase subunit 3|nr:MAG: cytochrome o ubiquinol oxidase subunit III [Pseudomonadota bacterium]